MLLMPSVKNIRWHITVDNEWEDESSKSKTVVEADLVPNQEIYSDLPVTRMEFIILLVSGYSDNTFRPNGFILFCFTNCQVAF